MSTELNFLERTAYKGRKLPDNLDMLLHLGIEHDDMHDAVKMHRVNSVIEYFKQFEDGMSVLRRVAIKAPSKEARVDRLWEYMKMRQQHQAESAEVGEMAKALESRQAGLRSLQQDIESYE